MRLSLSCGFLWLVVALAQGDDSCGQAPNGPSYIEKAILWQLHMFLPIEQYTLFIFAYFYYSHGDHIGWDRLESFIIAAVWEKQDWLIQEAANMHEQFLWKVERGSKKPIEPFRYRPLFRALNM
eukprot:TRINITY_DN11860_c0_g1_i1.p1 TRINITY_DN11860_c0_g1~~TRINITY_DN11860_c0_g1_i1.p1  ORF type:complete len:124 (-),score=15.71 TRINITY_DN11860_c0_g1_i1:53-424(-)